MDDLIRALETDLRESTGDDGSPREIPEFHAGDRIRVHERVTEGLDEGKSRVQVFDGIVLQVKGHGLTKTFTVRKESFGIGVEKIFPLYSPKIEGIEVVERGDVRQSRPFYLRKLRMRQRRR